MKIELEFDPAMEYKFWVKADGIVKMAFKTEPEALQYITKYIDEVKALPERQILKTWEV